METTSTTWWPEVYGRWGRPEGELRCRSCQGVADMRPAVRVVGVGRRQKILEAFGLVDRRRRWGLAGLPSLRWSRYRGRHWGAEPVSERWTRGGREFVGSGPSDSRELPQPRRAGVLPLRRAVEGPQTHAAVGLGEPFAGAVCRHGTTEKSTKRIRYQVTISRPRAITAILAARPLCLDSLQKK